MEQKIYDAYTRLLHQELVTATGCTEPIAIAYAGALARQLLGKAPQRLRLACSGNIIKNVKGVTVPNSGGQRGMETAALLGAVGGNADKALGVLEDVTPEACAEARRLLEQGACVTSLIKGDENLRIILEAFAGEDAALVEIAGTHTNVVRMEKNGRVLIQNSEEAPSTAAQPDKSLLNVQDILTYGETVPLERIRGVLSRQMECNSAISAAGMDGAYGTQVEKTLLHLGGTGYPALQAAAAAAAGSDARMNGCPLPVVINSGSGNQGLTITMPVLVYANYLNAGEETTLRALAIANLLSLHQKRFIGRLSAYCGATSAACAAAAAICWMMGGSHAQVCGVITNTLGTIGGMLCDGAKSSCASKIAAAVQTALLGMHMSMEGHCFAPGEGVVSADVEKTIADMGRIARDGMRTADEDILNIMLEAR